MKYLLRFFEAFLLLFVFQPYILAQNTIPVKFGKVEPKDFEINSPLIDSSTNALVIADMGYSEFVANHSELTFSLSFSRKKRIKIINKNGLDAATVVIPLYIGKTGESEKLESLEAFTYNLENGQVVKTKLEKSAIFSEKQSKNWEYRKFTFPAVKEGSILEYSQEIKSPYFMNLQSWQFQGEYPVLWSEYQTSIPEFFEYVILSQGYQPFIVNKEERSFRSYEFVAHKSNTNDGDVFNRETPGSENFKIEGALNSHTWVIKNAPALKEEAFTTNIENSISKIEFQLKYVAFPNSMRQSYLNSWKKVSEDLFAREDFGLPINRANNWLDGEIQSAIGSATAEKDKAKRIYEYIRDNYTSKDNTGIYMHNTLKEVVKNRSGSPEELNFLLIAMLKNQKITADPVILSTRENGITNEYYPLIDRYNYLIAKVTIKGESFYLDATIPNLAFSKLPLKVYNGHARILVDEAMPVYFLADSLLESNSTMVVIENNEKGEPDGSYTSNYGYYQSLALRNKIAKSGFGDFKMQLEKTYGDDLPISNIVVDSLKLLDEPVSLKFDIKPKGFGDGDIVYFNPLLGDAIKKNPFISTMRFHPVEMPYTTDNIYSFVMDIPKGYKVDELPKSTRLSLNEEEGMFEYLISADQNAIQLRCRVQLKKANFGNDDYESLRAFYTFIVKKEAEQIVFKKNK